MKILSDTLDSFGAGLILAALAVRIEPAVSHVELAITGATVLLLGLVVEAVAFYFRK